MTEESWAARTGRTKVEVPIDPMTAFAVFTDELD
jgi:hypothetical protein